jgi:hypothetical protein
MFGNMLVDRMREVMFPNEGFSAEEEKISQISSSVLSLDAGPPSRMKFRQFAPYRIM